MVGIVQIGPVLFFADLGSGTTDMEGSHRKLSTGLTNRLRSDNTYRFTDLDGLVLGKVTDRNTF